MDSIDEHFKPYIMRRFVIPGVVIMSFAVGGWIFLNKSGEPAKGKPEKTTETCTIKGNITDKGERIYHTPDDQWYSKTKIDENKGER
ncbi:MAG: hypothetical protein WCJ64_25465 [Rhodospirillaceae bacterium]